MVDLRALRGGDQGRELEVVEEDQHGGGDEAARQILQGVPDVESSGEADGRSYIRDEAAVAAD